MTLSVNVRNNKVKESGETVGKQIQVKEENKDTFHKEDNDLRNTEIDLKFGTLQASELEDYEISPKDLILLDWLIV